jgi:hypothetical protein
MMSDLYHIYIWPKSGTDREAVEAVLSKGMDWLRYHNHFYILETRQTADTWQKRLLPLVEPDGHLFICRFDPQQYHGWMSRQFWDWFQKKITKKSPKQVTQNA